MLTTWPSNREAGTIMAKGYATHATSAERDLLAATEQLRQASRATTAERRGHHLGWAIAFAEGAARHLRQADPANVRLHHGTGPYEAQHQALSKSQQGGAEQ